MIPKTIRQRDVMRGFRLIAALLIILNLAACQTLTAGWNFEESSREYNQMVRWNLLDNASDRFAEKSIREEFRKRVEAAKNVKIIEYRVKSMASDPGKGEAEVRVEIDYYIPPSTTVKTLEDIQKWTYGGNYGKRQWLIKSLLPEFK